MWLFSGLLHPLVFPFFQLFLLLLNGETLKGHRELGEKGEGAGSCPISLVL